eukprot:1177340-Pyramimonas_sp.AAC.1
MGKSKCKSWATGASLVIQDYSVPTYFSLDHQKSFRAPESTRTGGVSRVGPWEARLVRHRFDTVLGARTCFWDVVLKCDGASINPGLLGTASRP